MPKRYSMILILYLLTMCFGPLMPGISIICAIGLFCMDGVMRFVLLRWATFQIQVGHELGRFLASALPAANIVYAIMNMILYRKVHGSFSPLHFVTLGITIVAAFLPVRRLIDSCCVPKVERNDEDTYQDHYWKFKHYDFLNPITRFTAIQWLKSLSLKFNIRHLMM